MPSDTAATATTSAFAALLRSHRQARGLTQEEFAGLAGVGVRTLRDLERGRARPQRATVELLAAALDLRGVERTEFTLAARRHGGTDPIIEPEHGVNLPPAPVLVGRDDELANLSAALRHAAMITLVGVAGVGKTSLGWLAAHQVAHRHPGGVAGIAISEVSTEADILATVATVFDVPRARDLPARLAGRPALLLVDAVERSADHTVAALRWLRANTTSLRVIATARHPTGIGGEYVWPVAPLETPPPRAIDLDEIMRYPAAELFVDRLNQVGHAEIRQTDARAVAELVRRLGGLPLALELAAGRGRVLSVPEILERYGNRVLDLSGTAGRGGEPTTLRDAVAASYRMLEPVERQALRRLAQFRNRWSVELAEPLLADLAPVQDIVVLLDRLVGLGLVNVRGTSAVRFRLLDMVRDFATEQAELAGERLDDRARHARLFAQYAARTAPELVGRTLPAAIARLDDVASDLRAALVYATEHDPGTGLRLAGVLPRWWRFRGQDRSGRECLRRLLDDPRAADVEPTVRAWARLGLAQLATEHGGGAVALPEAEAALETFVRHGDVSGQLASRNQLCVLHQVRGDYAAARAHGEAVLALATRHGRTRDIVVAQNNLTWHEIRTGDLVAARRRLNAVQRLAAEVGEHRLRALAHANLAEVARLDGRYGDAAAVGRRAVTLLEELGDPAHRRRVLGTVALALAQAGRVTQAREVLPDLRGDPVTPLVEGYLALALDERATAAERFAAAAEALDGRYDARDLVEAQVGLVASIDDPQQRRRAMADLEELCRRTGVSLLAREWRLLGI